MKHGQETNEFRAAEIFTAAQVNDADLNWAVPRYARHLRRQWLFPTFFWPLLAGAGGCLIFADLLAPWGRLGSGLLIFYAALQYGTRVMAFEHFKDGLDLGKIAGVLRERGIEHGRWDDISEKGHGFIIECEVGAYGSDEDIEG